ncbi:MAG TPA: hypothetical protein VHQ20_02565 [Patescibacteria group bacterium]|jgi:hypothetical protein|nr:hypothetical protein [Patescibacteria group bacterium]
MQTKKIFSYVAPSVLAGLMLTTSAGPAMAAKLSTTSDTRVGNVASVKLTANENALRIKANAQIDARIKSLQELNTRIAEMKRLNSTQKAKISGSILSSIQTMTALKAKIAADTDSETLKADQESITKSYRIFALVMPQGRIEAAADRIMTITGLMTTLSTKLETRINTAQTAGNNVTALQTALADMKAKIADATSQAQSAVNFTAGLSADNGDQATMDANKAALNGARVKIKAAIADIKVARQDAGTIIKGLLSFKTSAKASATTSTK